MSLPYIVVFDFDSTFMQVEGMDELAAIALEGKPEKETRLSEIAELTHRAMAGELSFAESLEKRIALLDAHHRHLPALIEVLKTKVSTSIAENKSFFLKHAADILIISSGFREFIEPIVADYGIKPTHVYANTYQFDVEGNIIGVDSSNPLSGDKGKVKLIQQLNLPKPIMVVGDGYTDYEIKEAGLAAKFYAFTENIFRETVAAQADSVLPSLDEFLFQQKLPMRYSYPKNRINVLLLENIHPHAVQLFQNEGYNVETITTALDEDELCERIKEVSILGIRSKTQVTEKVLAYAERLIGVGAFCIGTNQIDLNACLKKGVVAFNAPFSNSRSVVEMAIGEMIVLIRQIAEKSQALHQGNWIKSSKNSYEIRGKKLGIVGYGNIGTQLSVLAEGLGMQVYYYDVVDKLSLGNAKKCRSLHELLSEVDVVTIHVDGRKENTHLIGEAEFSAMKPGVVFMNLSRGHIVDIGELAKNIKSGKVQGAAIDVFPHEPKNNGEGFSSELQGLPNLLLTPHIGGSTEEAQLGIADYVPSKIIQYVNSGNTHNSVNFPNMVLPDFAIAHRLIHVHANVPGVMAKINTVLSEHSINILGQYLKTNAEIGYVITDIDKEYNTEVIEALKAIPNTIKFRVLY